MQDYRRRIFEYYVSFMSSNIYDFSIAEYLSFAKEFSLNYSAFLPEDKNADILEIGCGPGFFLYYLEKNGYLNYTGVDFSYEQVRLAQKMCQGNIYQEDGFLFLSKSENKYDFIASSHVFEHFSKKEVIDILDNIHLHLKQCGKVMINVPNAGSPIFGSYNRYVDLTHEVGFTTESLKEILSVTGFEVLHVGPYKVRPLAKRVFFAGLNKCLNILSRKDIFIDTSIFAVGARK